MQVKDLNLQWQCDINKIKSKIDPYIKTKETDIFTYTHARTRELKNPIITQNTSMCMPIHIDLRIHLYVM